MSLDSHRFFGRAAASICVCCAMLLCVALVDADRSSDARVARIVQEAAVDGAKEAAHELAEHHMRRIFDDYPRRYGRRYDGKTSRIVQEAAVEAAQEVAEELAEDHIRNRLDESNYLRRAGRRRGDARAVDARLVEEAAVEAAKEVAEEMAMRNRLDGDYYSRRLGMGRRRNQDGRAARIVQEAAVEAAQEAAEDLAEDHVRSRLDGYLRRRDNHRCVEGLTRRRCTGRALSPVDEYDDHMYYARRRYDDLPLPALRRRPARHFDD